MSLWKKWAGVAALASVASAAVLMGSIAGAGIVGSKHDLSASGPGGKFTFTNGNTEICVFCHTPHGSDTASAVPLWNRVPGAAAGGFTVYTSTTLSGTVTMANSPSLVCLSCHDGTVAMNNMINAPGSDGYNSAGALAGGSWTAGGNVLGTGLMSTGITNIGTDLRNDHQVAVQYGGGFTVAPTASANIGTATFRDPGFNPVSGAAGTSGWWVDTIGVGTGGVRDKTDLWLYTRADASLGGANVPYVECASCHTPHDNTAGTFLRTTNAKSNLCLSCHNK